MNTNGQVCPVNSDSKPDVDVDLRSLNPLSSETYRLQSGSRVLKYEEFTMPSRDVL